MTADELRVVRELAGGLVQIAGAAARDSFVAYAIRAAGDRLAVAETLEDVRAALDGLCDAVAPLT